MSEGFDTSSQDAHEALWYRVPKSEETRNIGARADRFVVMLQTQ